MAEPKRAFVRRQREVQTFLRDPVRPGVAARTVLLVETNAFVVDVIESALKPLRASLVHAASADAALALARITKPMLIIMEVALPGPSGYDALAQLKNEPALSGIPVIALTARPLSEERLYLEHAGFAAALGKPLDLNALLAQVRRYL
jgi:hypothetical protein